VTSEGKPVNVFVARMSPTAVDAPADSDFVKLGKTPLVFELPPGSYRLEAEGFEVSNTGMLLEMRGEPKTIKVRTGSEGLATAGTLLMGIGILGVVGATAILASGSKAPSKLDKASVLVPMYVAGGLCFGGGLTMTLVGGSHVDEQKAGGPKPSGAWLGLRGTFW